MSTQKQSTVNSCIFSGEWKAPNGSIFYYHDLTLENGDAGPCGIVGQKNPDSIKPGAVINYTIDEKGKIKLISSQTTAFTQGAQKQGGGKSSGYNKGPKQPDEFLGYVWGYAKDLVIAGKTMEDVETINKMARYMYDEIQKMLQNK